MAICKGCGKKILWGQTEDGKNIPLDPIPPVYCIVATRPNGNLFVEKTDQEYMVSHFATCPKADEFSKSKKDKKTT